MMKLNEYGVTDDPDDLDEAGAEDDHDEVSSKTLPVTLPVHKTFH